MLTFAVVNKKSHFNTWKFGKIGDLVSFIVQESEVFQNCLPFFCVTFSHERKSERIEKIKKHKIWTIDNEKDDDDKEDWNPNIKHGRFMVSLNTGSGKLYFFKIHPER